MLGLERKHAWEVFINSVLKMAILINDQKEFVGATENIYGRAQGTKLGHTQLNLVDLSATLADFLVHLMKIPAPAQRICRKQSKSLDMQERGGSRNNTRG